MKNAIPGFVFAALAVMVSTQIVLMVLYLRACQAIGQAANENVRAT